MLLTNAQYHYKKCRLHFLSLRYFYLHISSFLLGVTFPDLLECNDPQKYRCFIQIRKIVYAPKTVQCEWNRIGHAISPNFDIF